MKVTGKKSTYDMVKVFKEAGYEEDEMTYPYIHTRLLKEFLREDKPPIGAVIEISANKVEMFFALPELGIDGERRCALYYEKKGGSLHLTNLHLTVKKHRYII